MRPSDNAKEAGGRFGLDSDDRACIITISRDFRDEDRDIRKRARDRRKKRRVIVSQIDSLAAWVKRNAHHLRASRTYLAVGFIESLLGLTSVI